MALFLALKTAACRVAGRQRRKRSGELRQNDRMPWFIIMFARWVAGLFRIYRIFALIFVPATLVRAPKDFRSDKRPRLSPR